MLSSNPEAELQVIREFIKPFEDELKAKASINPVGGNRHRVNLYVYEGDLIRSQRMVRSFFLIVKDGQVEDLTIDK